MEPSQRTATTDVIFSGNLSHDFSKCCEIFTKNDHFIINGKVREKQLWAFPHLVKYFVNNEANQAIIKLAFDTICNYEKQFAGSGLSFLNLVQSNHEFTASRKIRASSTAITGAIQKNLQCVVSKNILQQIKSHGNPQLSISVQRAPIEKPLLKFNNSPNVRLRIAAAFTIKQNKLNNCYFFMVNGAAASTSEITKLLNESFENKDRTYFFVCKSFTDEVVYTLKENYDRGITNVIPVEFGFDLDSINSLPDLQSIVGGLPFSSDLGDIIAAADFSRMGYSESVKIFNNSFAVKPSVNNKNYVNKLSKQIQESNTEKRKLLSKRLISLKGNSCNVYLPDKPSFDNSEINIRHSVLLMNQMSKYGMVEIKVSKNKFYIPATSYTIITEIKNRIEDLLQTKIFLPRRKT